MPSSHVDTAGLATDAALTACLDGVATIKGACSAVVQLLAAHPGLMPALYLERAGRLRCQAVAGYWQVFDGLPPRAGVIGATFASGTPTVLPNTGDSDGYLEAVPGVRSEVCVPIRLKGRVIGALNVESAHELSERIVPALERCATHVAARIGELGGMPEETRSERLAHHAVALSDLVEREAILARVAEAACDVAEMDSVAIGLADPGGLHLAAAEGTHASAMRALAPEELKKVAGWMHTTTSVRTIGEAEGGGFAGHEPLRHAGAEALIALPLIAGTGFLLLLDSAPIALETEDIELLELLASHAHERARHGHGARRPERACRHRPADRAGPPRQLPGRIAGGLRAPRAPRQPGPPGVRSRRLQAVNDTLGHQAGDHMLRKAATSLREDLRSGEVLYRIGGDEFAALLTVSHPDEAMDAAERLRRTVSERMSAGISVGVALHTRPEDPEAFFARADAALYDAKRGGGNRAAMDARS